MQNKNLIPIAEFSIYQDIDMAFILSLQHFELADIILIEEKQYLRQEQLNDIIKMANLHFGLDINLEGIDAIRHLQARIDLLQSEIILVQNKLRRFEEENP